MSAASADFTGPYLYAINYYIHSTEIWRYRIDEDNGTLTAVPGSPYTRANASLGSVLTSTSIAGQPYLYAADINQQIYGYAVNYSTGALTEISGSPYETVEDFGYPQAVIVDNKARFLWTVSQAPDAYPPQDWFTIYDVDSNGTLVHYTIEQTGTLGNFAMTEDGSGSYLYTAGNNCSTNPC